jgi:uncharacterized YigZ family protein
MSAYSFFTIEDTSYGIYKEKGSKFLSFAIPVDSELSVKQKLAELKKKYYDAHHHCYAYVLGADKDKFKAFDDGEPNHSAGAPILGQLRAKDLTNVLIVVVRYFGGVKLGVGGLLHAYKSAAEDALANSIISEKAVTKTIVIGFDYQYNTEAMKLIKEFDLEILDQHYGNEGKLLAKMQLRCEEKILAKVKLLNDLKIPIQINFSEPAD